MTVISNTSPVSNLAVIGRLSLLRNQFKRVLIPTAVDTELAQVGHVAASNAIRVAKAEGWLEVLEAVRTPLVRVFEENLDSGEAFAIAMALELEAVCSSSMKRTDGTSRARQASKFAESWEFSAMPSEWVKFHASGTNSAGSEWRHTFLSAPA